MTDDLSWPLNVKWNTSLDGAFASSFLQKNNCTVYAANCTTCTHLHTQNALVLVTGQSTASSKTPYVEYWPESQWATDSIHQYSFHQPAALLQDRLFQHLLGNSFVSYPVMYPFSRWRLLSKIWSLIIIVMFTFTFTNLSTQKWRHFRYCKESQPINQNLQSKVSTRKLCYRKDDRAMRHIGLHGCPENFRESLTTPTATIPNIFHGLLFGSTHECSYKIWSP